MNEPLDEYDLRELREFERERREIERQSLAWRREAVAALYHHFRDDPDSFAERVGWVISGEMGRGAQIQAVRHLTAGPRTNRVAGLLLLTALLDERAPAREALRAWKQLSPLQQNRLRRAIEDEVERVVAERVRNGGWRGPLPRSLRDVARSGRAR